MSLGDSETEANPEAPAEMETSATEAPAKNPVTQTAAAEAAAAPAFVEEAAKEAAPEEAPAEAQAADMGELMEQMEVAAPSSEGAIVQGHVVEIREDVLVVDVGSKTEGTISRNEFLDSEGNLLVERGQEIPVLVESEDKEGNVRLSFSRARRRLAWEAIERSHRESISLTGRVVDKLKGGLAVDIGIKAFLPASHVDLRPVRNLDEWKGQEVDVRVIKLNRKRGNVVVSRRVILEEERDALRARLVEILEEGTIVNGKVKNVTDYGAFVDLGGLDGLLHVTDMSWGRVGKPSDVVQPGQDIEVVVLRFAREKGRVSLGLKQLQPDPWADAPDKYPIGERVQGKVVSVTDYGAFVELEPGVEGLVHISEMSWSKRAKHPSKIVSVGDAIEVVVLDVKPEERRIALGLKQTEPDPWALLAQKYPINSVIKGRVRNLTDFGAFVEVEEGIDGLIHVSDMSWTKRVKHPSEMLKKGDQVEARVLQIDVPHRRLSLGIKQLHDIWEGWFARNKVGDVVKGKVVRVTAFGAFIELEEGIEGLCHISEVHPASRGQRSERPAPAGRAERPEKIDLEVGQEYEFKIIKLNQMEHKIGLSYRAALNEAERKTIQQYRSSKSSSRATIGDMILSKRGGPLT